MTSSTATSSKQTAGMRSPFVRLEPSGKGHALFEGQAQHDIEASQLIYIPPATRHNIENSGSQTLEYVYIVAPVAEQPK